MQNLKVAAVGGVAGAIVFAGSSALAGTGVGGIFNLGQSNTVNQASSLVGTTAGDQLDVANNSAASNASAGAFFGKSATTGGLRALNTGGGPALSLAVIAGKAPFTTNSKTKVANLNSDLLDGVDSTGFLRTVAPQTLAGPVAGPGGVFTAQNNGTGAGLVGKTGSSTAAGVSGTNTAGGPGVFGSSASGLAGYFQGAVTVTGDALVSGTLTTPHLYCAGCVTPGDIGDPSPFYNFPATSGTTCPNPAPTDAESHFCTNWINYPSSSYETLGVYFDSFDIVHLKGLVKHVGPFVSEHIILELPSFFCGWDHDKIFPALASGQLARLDVALHHISGTGVNACDVSVSNDATIANDYLSLDGITWSVNQKNAGDAPPKVAPKKP